MMVQAIGIRTVRVLAAPLRLQLSTMGDNSSGAHPLGVAEANSSSLDMELTSGDIKPEMRNLGCESPKLRILPSRRSMKMSQAYGIDEVKELSIGVEEAQCGIEITNRVESMTSGPEDQCHSESQVHNVELPIQYSDFFVISIGRVDARPTYHCVDKIWPVGYASCWHDKITGSLYNCEVLDGGDSGPIFRIKRSSCCESPIPIASTLLSENTHVCSDSESQEDGVATIIKYDDHYEDDSVIAMLADPSLLMPDDFFSLICNSDKCHNSQLSNCMPPGASTYSEKSQNLDYSVLIGEIGELIVEESSPLLAWRSMASKVIISCRAIILQFGGLKSLCQHVAGRSCLASSSVAEKKSRGSCNSLTKFYGLPQHVNIPLEIWNNERFDIWCGELWDWLRQDRFGLDVGFVQEVVEQIPEVLSLANYILLNRRDLTSSIMVRNGLLNMSMVGNSKSCNNYCGKLRGYRKPMTQMVEYCRRLPSGKPVRLAPKPVGDLLQVWMFLWRFHGVLGLETPLSYEALEEEIIDSWCKSGNEFHGKQGIISNIHDGTANCTLGTRFEHLEETLADNHLAFVEIKTGIRNESLQGRTALTADLKCAGYLLTKVHILLLQIMLGELQSRLAAVVESGDRRSDLRARCGRKKDENFLVEEKEMMPTLPLNELTWPELARRYVLAFLLMGGNLDFSHMTRHRSRALLCCLRGDRRERCGSLSGVAAIEADSLLLAEATKKVFGSLNRDNNMLGLGDVVSDGNGEGIPEWAQALGPVKKLPTNVGSRIRNCVNEAMEKGPPEWAREILEHSISKEVYKGNASGPTKRAVLSVLAQACGDFSWHKPTTKKIREKYVCISEFVMKQCRIILREAAAADDRKFFCYLLGNKFDRINDGKANPGSRVLLPCPLDFRMIDSRLKNGAYDGSHEAFLEDVRQLWMNIRIAFQDQPDMVHLAETLSNNFETLYERKVNALYRELVKYSRINSSSAESTKEVENLLDSVFASEISKAPWEEGICKVCGIDRDDSKVLLCDECDGEYHIYCLIPPVVDIPAGNWYCPICVVHDGLVKGEAAESWITSQNPENDNGKFSGPLLNMVARLSTKMEGREYWELPVDERTFLLKFLCDEILNSSLIRQHLETCTEACVKLKQKASCRSSEFKALKKGKHSARIRRMRRNIEDVTIDELSPFHAVNHDQCNSDKQLSTNSASHVSSLQCIDSSSLLSSELSQQDIRVFGGEKSFRGSVVDHMDGDMTERQCPEDFQGYDSPTQISSITRDNSVMPMEVSEAQSEDWELNSNRNEMLLWQNSTNYVEMQQENLCLRSKFLGCDSAGRFYWIMVNPGMETSVIVYENKELLGGKLTFHGEGSNTPSSFAFDSVDNKSCWFSYQSEAEIKGIMDFLKDDDPHERHLRESILHWWKLRSLDSLQSEKDDEWPHPSLPLGKVVSNSLMTKAASVLEVKYGYCVEPEAKVSLDQHTGKGKAVIDNRMYRCQCLEPIWPSRHHCPSCHRTFSKKVDFRVHDCGKCGASPGVPEKNIVIGDAMKGKDIRKPETTPDNIWGKGTSSGQISESLNLSRPVQYQSDGLTVPFTLEGICSKFATCSCNRELLNGIGLIGSNGIPSFVSSVSPYFSDPAVKLNDNKKDGGFHAFERQASESSDFSLENRRLASLRHGHSIQHSPRFCDKVQVDVPKADEVAFEKSEQKDESAQIKIRNYVMVPESSLRPLVGKSCHVFRRLKINLLDMDAAIPEAALRASKAQIERRWTWRDFVKSARSIYELVQALIVFEDSIKTEYLSDAWCYWSSPTTAARISTLSSLALHLYSLDAAIKYHPISSDRSNEDSSEKYKQRRQPNKKRKKIEV